MSSLPEKRKVSSTNDQPIQEKKKKLTHEEKVDWAISFHQPHYFRMVMRIVSKIIPQVTFIIENPKKDEENKFTGISVCSMNKFGTALLLTRVLCDITYEDETRLDKKFTVASQTLNRLLFQLTSTSTLSIYKKGDRLYGRPDRFDPNQMHFSRFEIPMLESKGEDIEFHPGIEYKYHLELGTKLIKKNVSLAKDLNADSIRFSIRVPKKQVKGYDCFYFVIEIEEESAKMTDISYSMVPTENKFTDEELKNQIQPLNQILDIDLKQKMPPFPTDEKDYEETYSGKFYLNILQIIFNTFEQTNILLLVPEKGSDAPLIFQYLPIEPPSTLQIGVARKHEDSELM